MIGRLVVAAALVVVGAGTLAAPAKKAPVRAAVRDWTRTVVATPEGGARMGNPAAPVKLIEYGSRTCPHCAHFAVEGVPALKAGYIATGQVSYEFRDFPIHNALDLGPILLGRCAPVARFFPLLDAMMAEQGALLSYYDAAQAAVQALPADAAATTVAATYADALGYRAFVEKRGVPAARARACLADKAALDAVVARADAAQRTFAVASTPTFIVNGTVATGVGDWAALEPVLRAAVTK